MSVGPLVIGGTGGSGTRLFTQLAQAAGVQMGSLLNESGDQLEVAAYHDRWINRWLTDGRRATERVMAKELSEIVSRHRTTSEGAWGWKEPRNVFVVEFLDRTLEGMRFVHVVRDGRDMAFSTNQNQLRKHGEAVLGSPGGESPERSIALWSKVNERAADYGEEAMGSRYVRLRFEDLLGSPDAVARQLSQFLGADLRREAVAALELERPASAGVWKTRDATTLAALERSAGNALRRFGYEPEAP